MSSSDNLLVKVAAGETLVRAGDSGRTLYLVESGKIALHPADRPESVQRRLGPGAMFGESAALGSGTYLYSATAETDSRLLPLDRDALMQLVRSNPDAGFALLTRLAEAVEATARQGAGVAADAGAGAADEESSTPAADEPRTERPFVPPERPVAPPPGTTVIALTVASGEAIVLDPSANAFLVGRPDPNSGSTPEVNLGPFDVHRSLSRRHARILRDGDRLLLREESGVANGTFLNDRRLNSGEAVSFQPGDKLRFGAVEVDVVAIQTTG